MANSTPRHADVNSTPKTKPVVAYNRARRKKSAKPKFPLWIHATGQWAKKIRGRYHYFGIDKDAALKEYARVSDPARLRCVVSEPRRAHACSSPPTCEN